MVLTHESPFSLERKTASSAEPLPVPNRRSPFNIEKAFRFIERYLNSSEREVRGLARDAAFQRAYGVAEMFTKIAALLSKQDAELPDPIGHIARTTGRNDVFSGGMLSMEIVACFELAKDDTVAAPKCPNSQTQQHANMHNASVGLQIGIPFVRELVRSGRIRDVLHNNAYKSDLVRRVLAAYNREDPSGLQLITDSSNPNGVGFGDLSTIEEEKNFYGLCAQLEDTYAVLNKPRDNA
ncbi:MAG: hypothetical protein IT567_02640 [Alphaproteobacteria bacterium]|nr:hypothetical protein [Alphaproteobacteria bacterium]